MNPTPRGLNPLLALARELRRGAATLEEGIGLHHYTQATLNAAILKLEGDPAAPLGSEANRGSQLLYKSCEDAAGEARAALKQLSDGPVRQLLAAYRDVLKHVHGNSHHVGWGAAGFTQNLRVPFNHEERQTLLAVMRSYLVAHPAQEATLPLPGGTSLAVTAAAAQTLGVAFQAAFDLVNEREAEQVRCKRLRDADLRRLADEVGGMIRELGELLAPDDPRWEAFGLDIPARPRPPEAVPALELAELGGGRVQLTWQRGRRATYYRIFIQVEGVDADFRFLARDEDQDHLIENLPPGSLVHARIVAANAAGEAPPSTTVSVQLST